ncbi:MAG: GNAT family N-acetyltransferase [Bacteroidales bacterium]
MLDIQLIEKKSDFKDITREKFVEFLHTHLERFGDPLEEINNCLDYAMSSEKSAGGFALAAFEKDQMVGGLIMNRTGMGGYIPGWVLVYVAVDSKCRGKGYGRTLIEESFTHCDGDVKLHVEYDNPAKRLYERIGFTNKYAEMRYTKSENNR